jgi:hypothetical protein
MIALRSPLQAILAAVYSRLFGVIVCPIYYKAPKGAAFPYVVLGTTTMEDWRSDSSTGAELTLELDIFSARAGGVEAIQIQGQIIQLLTATPLDLSSSGFSDTGFTLEFATSFEEESRFFHAVCRFQTWIDDLTD